MRSQKTQVALLCAILALQYSMSAAAEDEESADKHRPDIVSPSPFGEKDAAATTNTHPPPNQPAQPSTPSTPSTHSPRATSYHQNNRERIGGAILGGVVGFLLQPSPSEPAIPRPPKPPFIYDEQLEKRVFLGYFDGGIGVGILHNPSVGDPNFSMQFAVGVRTKYLGLELAAHLLRAWNFLLNSPEYVNQYNAENNTANAFSYLLVGYIPWDKDSDILLKFGPADLSITDYTDPNNTVVTNGKTWVRGIGWETRDNTTGDFLRLEAGIFGKTLQLKPHYYGVAVGTYF